MKPACLYPFNNIMVTADGAYRPCCKYLSDLKNNGEVLSTKNHDISAALDATDSSDLRRAFTNGEKPAGCRVCFEEDAKSIRSMRHDSFSFGWNENVTATTFNLRRLDVYFGNLCNLKCRICCAENSSRWAAEEFELRGIKAPLKNNVSKVFVDGLNEALTQIDQIGFAGGEPMLYRDEFCRILDYFIDAGRSQEVSVLVNTNTTIYAPDVLARLKRFKKVWLNFSVDDIGPRFEYQRSGAKWPMARDVIRAYAQAGVSFEEEGQIIGKICCVVSLFNVFYLPELVDWAAKDFPGLRIFLSVLHQPEFFSIKNLPKPLKQTISAKLRSHSSVYNQPKASGLDRTFHDVDHFMMEEAESNMIAAALNEIDVRDRLRKEKFSEVFPELANVLF